MTPIHEVVGVVPSELDDWANVRLLAISGSVVFSKPIILMICVVIVYLISALKKLDTSTD